MNNIDSLDKSKKLVAVLANPRAGSGNSQRLVLALTHSLRSFGLQPKIFWERDAFSEMLGSGAREDLRCVVAAGGDGTLLEVLNRAPALPVALLPIGNENLVARHLHARRSPQHVGAGIFRGQIIQTDLATLNNRLFCVMAGIGVDAEVVRRVHEKRKGHISKLAYVVPTLQSFGDYTFPRLSVRLDSGETLNGSMAFVFNIPEYALGLRLAPGADPSDGLLDVYVFERPGLSALARYFRAILFGHQERLPDHHHRAVKRVWIESTERTPIQTDGDPAGYLPAQIEVAPAALTLVVTSEYLDSRITRVS